MTTKSAPGKHYRKGMTLQELFKKFPDDAAAEAWFAEQRWPDGPTCPHCESDNIQTGTTHPTMPYRCRACRKFFSVKTGTVMQSSKLGYQTWALAIYLFNTNIKGTSSMKLHRDLGITQKAAWHLAHRIREGYKVGKVKFGGPVEADETYIGGKQKWKHADKKLNIGGGTAGKAIVAGLKDQPTNQIAAAVIPSVQKVHVIPFVADQTEQLATVYTDDLQSYVGMPRMHKSVNHSIGQYVDGQAHVNGVESF